VTRSRALMPVVHGSRSCSWARYRRVCTGRRERIHKRGLQCVGWYVWDPIWVPPREHIIDCESMGVGVEWVWRWVWATVEVGKRCKPGKENTRHVSRVLIKGKDTHSTCLTRHRFLPYPHPQHLTVGYMRRMILLFFE